MSHPAAGPGLTPLAGLWTLPWSCGFIVGSMAAPALARLMRPAGLTAGTLLMSLGLAPVVAVGTDLVVGAAPPARAGAAAAISETSSELGGALGIAILGRELGSCREEVGSPARWSR